MNVYLLTKEYLDYGITEDAKVFSSFERAKNKIGEGVLKLVYPNPHPREWHGYTEETEDDETCEILWVIKECVVDECLAH